MTATASPLTIILATVIPFVFVLVLVLVLWRCARKRSYELFSRGITPVADEEIESWKNDRSIDDSEKEPIPEPLVRGHTRGPSSNNNSHDSNVIRKPEATIPLKKYHQHQKQQSSTSSITKPPSVIVYQNAPALVSSASEEMPRSAGGKYSMELPQTPVLARAPNARPGLTDDAVQGDEPFVPPLKRQPSRLSKNHPTTQTPTQPPQHQRHKSAYGAVGGSGGRGDRWYGSQSQSQSQDYMSRKSADNIPRRGTASGRGHERIYSATANPPRMSLDDTSPGGLSPRPLLHKSEIGRAIG